MWLRLALVILVNLPDCRRALPELQPSSDKEIHVVGFNPVYGPREATKPFLVQFANESLPHIVKNSGKWQSSTHGESSAHTI
jgi:hypothetical protein